jgi:hypothetical protein
MNETIKINDARISSEELVNHSYIQAPVLAGAVLYRSDPNFPSGNAVGLVKQMNCDSKRTVQYALNTWDRGHPYNE